MLNIYDSIRTYGKRGRPRLFLNADGKLLEELTLGFKKMKKALKTLSKPDDDVILKGFNIRATRKIFKIWKEAAKERKMNILLDEISFWEEKFYNNEVPFVSLSRIIQTSLIRRYKHIKDSLLQHPIFKPRNSPKKNLLCITTEILNAIDLAYSMRVNFVETIVRGKGSISKSLNFDEKLVKEKAECMLYRFEYR